MCNHVRLLANVRTLQVRKMNKEEEADVCTREMARREVDEQRESLLKARVRLSVGGFWEEELWLGSTKIDPPLHC